jgi:hypothetical protein
MDATSRPQPQFTSVSDILDRAERLTAAEIRALASAYRGETQAGQQDPVQRDRGRRRSNALSIAIKRSKRADEAQSVQDSASEAVRTAAARSRGFARMQKLAVVPDASLAVAEAALAILLADSFSAEIAGLLREPFDAVVVDDAVPDGAVLAGGER